DLRRFLKERLPDFMIPAAFVRMERLPRLPHGKIDLRALPEPVMETRDREPELPTGMVERQLVEILSEVLGADRVGIRDNFFELGGDSILSIQVSTRANRLGLRLTPRQVFQYPTVAELAQVAGTGARSGTETGAVEGPVLLTPIQAAFFERDVAEPQHFNQ